MSPIVTTDSTPDTTVVCSQITRHARAPSPRPILHTAEADVAWCPAAVWVRRTGVPSPDISWQLAAPVRCQAHAAGRLMLRVRSTENVTLCPVPCGGQHGTRAPRWSSSSPPTPRMAFGSLRWAWRRSPSRHGKSTVALQTADHTQGRALSAGNK